MSGIQVILQNQFLKDNCFDTLKYIPLNYEIEINTKINTTKILKISEMLEFVGGGDRNRTDE